MMEAVSEGLKRKLPPKDWATTGIKSESGEKRLINSVHSAGGP